MITAKQRHLPLERAGHPRFLGHCSRDNGAIYKGAAGDKCVQVTGEVTGPFLTRKAKDSASLGPLGFSILEHVQEFSKRSWL